jgi:indole-3-glycerol phosphate synthase
MDILNKIAAFKKDEAGRKKIQIPVRALQKSPLYGIKPPSFYESLVRNEPAIIGEFKRKSPSKGVINSNSDVKDVAKGYQDAGVAAMSILTDNEFFGGHNSDLSAVATFSSLPLLRKDFIVDEYQVIEAKSIGASAILLIGSILTREESKRFTKLAISLGLEVLFEIHDLEDLEKADENIRIVGVNNRNLRTFEVNMKNSIDLIAGLPQHCLKVAESGFQTVDDVQEMFSGGFEAFLIGERFMREDDPGKSASEFISGLKNHAK